MDLTTITVADFKAQFLRGFPYLPIWSSLTNYNIGDKVYYSVTGLFYKCKVNGTLGVVPTNAGNWDAYSDFVTNYVLDSDILNAFGEAGIAFNQSLFSNDTNIKLGYLYLTAHYLVNDLRTASGGIGAIGVLPLSSRSVGSVSESYSVPQKYLSDPKLAFFVTTGYGQKFLSLINLAGNVQAVRGTTLP